MVDGSGQGSCTPRILRTPSNDGPTPHRASREVALSAAPPRLQRATRRTFWFAAAAVLLEGCAILEPGQLGGGLGSAQARTPVAGHGAQSTAAAPPLGAVAPTSAAPPFDVPPAVAQSGPPAEPDSPASGDSASADDIPALLDPLQPGVRIDPNEFDENIDLWTRIRRGFAIPDLQGKLVDEQQKWYSSRPEYVQRMTLRGSRYLFHIVQEVERRGLPTELALLPFIESAFNPEAMSSARASGMWQFMPATGRVFDLKQNVFRDDRRDVLASTRAALDYLEKLYLMFGDWHLALAAYNWGEGSVGRAIAKNRAARKPTDYASLKMPNETRLYVPKFQAVKNIVARPESFGLELPELDNHPYFLSVPIDRDIDVEVAARLSGMDLDEFRALNPQMNKPVILAAGTPQVLLPYDNANRFVQELPEYRGRLASWTAWVAPTTLKPAEAAHRVGMDEQALRAINLIPPRMLIKAGSTLLVPRADEGHADVSEHLAENGTMTLTPDASQVRRVAMRAGRRDSVLSVARRYRLAPEHVAQWNLVDVGAAFRRGQTVVVYVPSQQVQRSKAPSASRGKAASARKSAARPPARVGRR